MSTVPLRPDFPEELVTPEIERSISLDTANSKELCKHKIGLAVKKFQIHKSDTGSPSVQSTQRRSFCVWLKLQITFPRFLIFDST